MRKITLFYCRFEVVLKAQWKKKVFSKPKQQQKKPDSCTKFCLSSYWAEAGVGKNCVLLLHLSLTLSLQEWLRWGIPAHWKLRQGNHTFLNSLATERALKNRREEDQQWRELVALQKTQVQSQSPYGDSKTSVVLVSGTPKSSSHLHWHTCTII